jgi:hypothetical protein
MTITPPPGGPEIVADEVVRVYDRILHPRSSTFAKFFRIAAIAIVSAILVIALALSSPLAPEQFLCLAPAFLTENAWPKESTEHWLDWLSMFSQIALILFIGGAAFTETFARRVAATADRLRAAALEAEQKEDEARLQKLKQVFADLVALADSRRSYVERARLASSTLGWLLSENQQISTRYFWFGLRGLAFNFPGGLYGLLGFMCLLIQVIALAVKSMLDHAPASCALG